MQNHKSVGPKMAQLLQLKKLQKMLHCFSALHFLYNVLICRHSSTHTPSSKNDRISSKLIYTPPFLMEVFAPLYLLTCFWHLLLAIFKMINISITELQIKIIVSVSLTDTLASDTKYRYR